MFALSLECGRTTSSWYAEFAFRRRVKKSAIGSVIVMVTSSTFLAVVPCRAFGELGVCGLALPAGLAHTGQLAAVRHLPHADPAQAELAQHRARPTAALAPGVGAHLELRLLRRLEHQSLLGHQFSLNGKPRCRRSARPSSSLVAVVTIVMSMPRCRSIESGSISWNMDCSLSPNV